MQDTQLQKANYNRQNKEVSLRTRQSISIANTLQEIEGVVQPDKMRYYEYNDSRLQDKLIAMIKAKISDIKAEATAIIDQHIRMLEDEFKEI